MSKRQTMKAKQEAAPVPAIKTPSMSCADEVRKHFRAANWGPTKEAVPNLKDLRPQLQREMTAKFERLTDADIWCLWVIVGRLTYKPIRRRAKAAA